MDYWQRRRDLFLKLRDAANATVDHDTAYPFLEAIDEFHRDFSNRPITTENLTGDEKQIVSEHLNDAVLLMAYGFCNLQSRRYFSKERLRSLLSGAEILRISLIADVFSPLLKWDHSLHKVKKVTELKNNRGKNWNRPFQNDALMRIRAVLHAELHLRLELKIDNYSLTVEKDHVDVSKQTMRYHDSLIDEYRLED
ncbi:hypothetical protein PRIPAC_91071 [Pristionchus pacificus]|uniref:Uncharacterized protein n=1 Tax=Pristionchus pacificus TaxID=54126 RepID=A0A2A6CT75_PRIPA|nr:hypothetical protein PRIPAC_91071 [Pristionchus pacificus]|eukprot:PDM81422.1 hypothetical protein PRIPAC_35298 [Pristionchus pacificus]